MKNILELGGETFEIVPNFRKSYNLTKYRNKIAVGFDFGEADKKVVAEILKATKDKDFDISTLSPAAISLLQEKNQTTLFNDKETFDIIRILTSDKDKEDITDEHIEELLDKEVQENGYDIIFAKLIECINLVFTNAKDISKPEETIKVAKK